MPALAVQPYSKFYSSLRGGSAAAVAPREAPAKVSQDVRLKVTAAAQSRESDGHVPLVALGSSALNTLSVKPGERVKLTRVKPSPWWKPSPNELVGEVAAEDPEIADDSDAVRVSAGWMRAVNFREGELVTASAAVAADGPRTEHGYYRRRRYNPWMRMLVWQTLYGGRGYGYGHGYGYAHGGHGYGYGKRDHYGKRTTFGPSRGGYGGGWRRR